MSLAIAVLIGIGAGGWGALIVTWIILGSTIREQEEYIEYWYKRSKLQLTSHLEILNG